MAKGNTHWVNLPSIKAGCVGVHPSTGQVGPMHEPGARVTEEQDDDTGRLSRYCNPVGYIGLHGEEAGANTWERTGGQREVKRGVQKGELAVKGDPFRGS